MSDSHHNRGEPEPELPPPSAELILLGSLTRAFLRTIPKAKRREFLRDVAEDLQWQADMASVLRIRPSAYDGAVAEARRKAQAWWVRIVDRLMTQLDR